MRKRFIIAQLGARMDYAVPRMLHQAGMLERFYADICATKGIGRLIRKLPRGKLPQPLKRLQARIPEGVPADKITTFDSIGIRYAIQRMQAKDAAEMTQAYLWVGEAFCRKVLERGLDTGNVTGIYTFDSAGLELLREAKSRGIFTVSEQTIAPVAVRRDLMTVENRLHPEWAKHEAPNNILDLMVSREREEWRHADVLLCGSDFVKESIQAVGGPHERCVVVPYGVDAKFCLPHKVPHNGPLRIVIIGVVDLRKGAPYVLEAAKKLKGQAVFRMVGSMSVCEKVRYNLAAHVELTGLVPRSEILRHYEWADVFLLPSICEGSATVVYEAMAAGLPVICTPNTGSVVRDGIEGFIVPIRSVDAVVDAIEKLKDDPSLWQEMSHAARARSQEFTLDKYQERLIATITQSSGSRKG